VRKAWTSIVRVRGGERQLKQTAILISSRATQNHCCNGYDQFFILHSATLYFPVRSAFIPAISH
jgi:hypothetical protein